MYIIHKNIWEVKYSQIFLCAGVCREISSAAARAQVGENGIFLLDCTAPCSGAMPLCGARANAVSLLDFFNIIIVPAVFHMPLVIRTVDILDLFGHRYTVGDRLVEDEPNLRGIPQIDLLCQ